MSNRRTQDSDYRFDAEDDPIGLTSAFPPTKGPQSVEYDKGDQAIGLTGAFAPIPEQNEPHAWDEAGKWKDFDWNASYTSEFDDADSEGQPTGEVPAIDAASAGGVAQVSSSQPDQMQSQVESRKAARGSGRGRHAAPDVDMSPRMQQAKKTRRLLIVLVVLLVIAIGVVAFFMVRMFSSSQQEAANQVQEQIDAPKEDIGNLSDGAHNTSARLTEVPYLTPVLGMSSDDAVEAIGHGATVTATRAVNEEGNPVKSSLNVSLTEEPGDSKTGSSPTVYLGLNEGGSVVQVGYSASAAALDFGSLSFADAVNNEHVVEKTLAKIGVDVPAGSVTLPADKNEYSTYNDDGVVTRERCSFEGDVEVDGVPCTWSSVLSYDYTAQMVSGDLADTVRIIYVYIARK